MFDVIVRRYIVLAVHAGDQERAREGAIGGCGGGGGSRSCLGRYLVWINLSHRRRPGEMKRKEKRSCARVRSRTRPRTRTDSPALAC